MKDEYCFELVLMNIYYILLITFLLSFKKQRKKNCQMYRIRGLLILEFCPQSQFFDCLGLWLHDSRWMDGFDCQFLMAVFDVFD